MIEADTNVRNMHDIHKEFKGYLDKVLAQSNAPKHVEQHHH